MGVWQRNGVGVSEKSNLNPRVRKGCSGKRRGGYVLVTDLLPFLRSVTHSACEGALYVWVRCCVRAWCDGLRLGREWCRRVGSWVQLWGRGMRVGCLWLGRVHYWSRTWCGVYSKQRKNFLLGSRCLILVEFDEKSNYLLPRWARWTRLSNKTFRTLATKHLRTKQMTNKEATLFDRNL